MSEPQPVANPFELMMDPQAVIKAMEASQRLSHLKRRICRPLDRPVIPRTAAETGEYDRTIDNAPEEYVGGDDSPA